MRFFGLVLIALLFPALAQADCDVHARATVPLEVIGRTILVRVMVNDIEGIFILDTGASRSVITRDATRHLQLARDEWVGTAMRGVGGVEMLPNANPRTITLGGVALMRRTRTQDHSLTVGTLPNTQAGNLTIDGLLGRDFLSVFDLALDLPARTVTLYDVRGCAGRYLPWAEPYTAIPVENRGETLTDSALIVPVTLDGIRLRAILDTGAGATLLAAPGMARVGLKEAVLKNDTREVVSGLGPRTVIMYQHRFTTLRVGTRTIDHPSLWAAAIQLNPIVDMLLGADWLEGKRVWISFATRQIFVAE
jgi:hypothetical protein